MAFPDLIWLIVDPGKVLVNLRFKISMDNAETDKEIEQKESD